MNITPKKTQLLEYPKLWRRFAAALYDLLLLLSLMFFAAAIVVVPLGMYGVKNLDKYLAFRIYLLVLIPTAFFCWFWTHGGQTLGMRAWRIKVVRHDGSPLTTRIALLRFMAVVLSLSVLGFGFIWSLWDSERRAWHDRITDTKLIVCE